MNVNITNFPKGADEFCLLGIQHWSTCMTKSEWSGWMQAVFSVVAILASSYVAWRLFRAEVREKRNEDLRVEADKLQDLLHLAEATRKALQSCVSQSSNKMLPTGATLQDLRDAADQFIGIPPSAIPSRMLRLNFAPLHRDVMVARTAIDNLVTEYNARNAWSEFCDPHLKTAGRIVLGIPPQLTPFQDRLAELKKRLKP